MCPGLKHSVLTKSTRLVSNTECVSRDNCDMNLIEDLERYRKENGLKKSEMARMFKVESQNYNNWVYRGSLPKEFYDLAILITTKDGKSNVFKLPKQSQQDRPESINIPRLDVSGSMGRGLAIPGDHVDVIEHMSVSLQYLRRTLSYSSASNLAIITGYGDSMEGTFSDGDLLLVDRGVTEIRIDAVYVLCLAEELYIKRIQRRPDGTLLMLSDNHKYPPYEIKNGELQRFQVLARVLLAWNAKRL